MLREGSFRREKQLLSNCATVKMVRTYIVIAVADAKLSIFGACYACNSRRCTLFQQRIHRRPVMLMHGLACQICCSRYTSHIRACVSATARSSAYISLPFAYRQSAPKRSALSASTEPDMVPVFVSRSRRLRSASTASTCAPSVARYTTSATIITARP